MVSNLNTRPSFLSTFKNRWHESHHEKENRDAAENNAVIRKEPVSNFETEKERVPNFKRPQKERRQLQSPRVLRRDSGSRLFHWGNGNNNLNKSPSCRMLDDDIRDDVPPQESHFGHYKPTFTESSDGKSLKPDGRKLMNAHLRMLSKHLDTKHLVLDKKGTAVFYVGKSLVRIHVPRDADEAAISTVVHRRTLQGPEHVGLLNRVLRKTVFPEFMSLTFNSRKSQMVVTSVQSVPSCYKDFQKSLDEFTSYVDEVKARIKREIEETPVLM